MQTKEQISLTQIWHILSQIQDPEIPVISITELGIIRDLQWQQDQLIIIWTPTYSGCPAISAIQLDIEQSLLAQGIENFTLQRQLSPPWSTDWISVTGRNKLQAYGIAPPVNGSASYNHTQQRATLLLNPQKLTIACPLCHSVNTKKISQFGSTACKASYQCQDCLEPFDYFKCI